MHFELNILNTNVVLKTGRSIDNNTVKTAFSTTYRSVGNNPWLLVAIKTIAGFNNNCTPQKHPSRRLFYVCKHVFIINIFNNLIYSR